MTDVARPRRSRLAAVGVGPVAVAAVHVAVRYLSAVLFGFVTYRGLHPVVPWLLSGAFLVTLVALAAVAVARRGWDGAILAGGLLVLAAEPFASALVYGDGCNVGAESGAALLPTVAPDGLAVVLGPWDGACSASISLPVVALGVLGIGLGLRRLTGGRRPRPGPE